MSVSNAMIPATGFLSLPDQLEVPCPGGSLHLPGTIRLDWDPVIRDSAALLDLVGRSPLPLDLLLDQTLQAARQLGPLHRGNVSCLSPWSLRWHQDRLLLALAPAFAFEGRAWVPPIGDPGPGAAPTRDLYLLGCALYVAAFGRWPGQDDMASVIATLGGTLPVGFDVALRACLHHEVAYRAQSAAELVARVAPFLEEPQATPVVVRRGLESVTGWRKSTGMPAIDNEDVGLCWCDETAFHGAVLDGVTGAGDGSGGRAARWLARHLRPAWQSGLGATAALQAANRQICGIPNEMVDGAAVAVAAHIHRDGSAEIAGGGDCLAYLVRPTTARPRATRLTPEDSVMAEQLRDDGHYEEAGAITNWLDGDPLELHSRQLRLAPGDILVLLSDGAALPDERPFADDLESLVAEQPRHAALLASQLCCRAEALGGHDNATALVLCVDADPDADTGPALENTASPCVEPV